MIISRSRFSSRDLLANWTRREFKVRYRQAVLGVAWAVLQPLAMMVIITWVFSRMLFVPAQTPYPLFVFSGLVGWGLFANAVSGAFSTVVDNFHIVSKVPFRREVLPISAVLVSVVDTLIAAVVLVAMMAYFNIPFQPHMLLVTVVFALQLLFTCGVALIVATAYVYFRDIRFVLPLLLQLWFFVSPVFYSIDSVSADYRWVFAANPIATFISTYRALLFSAPALDWNALLLAALVAVAVFAAGLILFRRAEKRFADLV